ncbi:MAG: threonine--tRNA ligase [Desulfurococcaceae archaeon]
MRLLLIHSKRFSYRVTEKAYEEAEETGVGGGEFSNALVIFTTVEDGDDLSVVKKAVNEVVNVVNVVKPTEVVIYPYAHLSSNLAPSFKALEVLELLNKELSSTLLIRVHRAPFGWYKAFQLECYGHPLSELSKTISSEVGEARRHEVRKEYLVLTPSGEVFSPEEFDYSKDSELKVLVEKEVHGRELEGGENRVNDYCKKYGFEWESYSDYGHMRYGPHAAAIMEAVEEYSWTVARSLGVPILRVKGTNTFDLSLKPVYEHAKLFGDRLYSLDVDGRKYVLRYAACHQQFSMIKDWVISYRNLPLGIFEVADSYRLEQRGELNLCFRTRKFYMPDLHILTKDLEQAVEESFKVQGKIREEAVKVGRKYVALYNVTKDFFKEHFDYLVKFVEREERPVLLCLVPEGIYYWVLNVEYHIIDNVGRPREIATFQIDVGNGERFGITYVDEGGRKRHPVIIHTALIGSIERYIYMVLDTAAKAEKSGETPYIPTWMSPIQVRVIPVSREVLSYAIDVAQELAGRGLRIDVDDRDESLGKKIRDAGREWIPYIAVIGRRELETKTVNVRERRTNDQRVMRVSELYELISKEIEGYPQVPQTLPILVSQRPSFNYFS